MCSTLALPAEAYCKASTKGFGSSVDVPARKHKSLDAQRVNKMDMVAWCGGVSVDGGLCG
jgi:hypothetical protein